MKYVIIFQIILLCVQTGLYFGIQKFEGPAHDVSCKLDKRIPYWPYSVFIYVLWFPLIAIFPLCVYWHDQIIYWVYISAISTDILISIIVYVIYPSSFERPDPPNGLIGIVMNIVYKCDYKGKNCMPSMHCSMCFIIIFVSYMCWEYNILLYSGFITLSILIVLSTVLTKQHVIIDVITGLLAAILSMFASLVMCGLN